MKYIDHAFQELQSGKLQAAVFLLIMSTLAPHCTLSAQSEMLWQSIGPESANSNSADFSMMSVVGQAFVGEASGNGILLRSGFGSLASSLTSVKSSNDKIPLTYTLFQNYPNPFNPSTIISFAIPEASHVVVKVFDVVGREVSTLVNEDLVAGNYRSTFIADHLSSGVYFYRIVAARKSDKGRPFVDTKKFVLIK